MFLINFLFFVKLNASPFHFHRYLLATKVISENSWSIPNVEDLSNYKASRFRTKIRDIKKGKVDEAAEDASLKPLPRRRPSSSSVVYKVPTAKPELGKEYDPRAKVEHTTESGVILPSNALAYGHIPMTQFKGNTVQRLDVGIPLTYTLRHLPLARTVPMLKVRAQLHTYRLLCVPAYSVYYTLILFPFIPNIR